MIRPYQEVALEGQRGRCRISLDGKWARTPARAPLRLPNRLLGEAVAAEWRAQGDKVERATMPLTILANNAIDRVAPRRPQVIEELLAYGGSDLLCYRASSPPDLVARQSELWDPFVTWAAHHYGMRFEIVEGISFRPQPPETLEKLGLLLDSTKDFPLAGLQAATTISGSIILALALLEEPKNWSDLWAAAQLDERYQAERWGSDAAASEAAERKGQDLKAAATFMELVQAGK